MAKHDDFTPEELDTDNQPLVEDLQQLYHTYTEDTLSVARVRKRLLGESDRAQNGEYLPTPNRQRVRLVSNESGRVWQRRLSTLVAVLVAAVLVGSILLLVTHARQGSTLAHGSASPTLTVVQISVPDLRGDTFQQAQAEVTKDGFTLQVLNGGTSGIVLNQDPPPGALAPKGSAIRVQFGPATQQTVVVPSNLVGNSLSAAETILNTDGIPYIIRPDGTDPKKQPNTVPRVYPPSGTSIPKGVTVTLYVVNLTNGTPVPFPSPTPTVVTPPTPTPAPFPSPTPTPTAISFPSPTPTPHQP